MGNQEFEDLINGCNDLSYNNRYNLTYEDNGKSICYFVKDVAELSKAIIDLRNKKPNIEISIRGRVYDSKTSINLGKNCFRFDFIGVISDKYQIIKNENIHNFHSLYIFDFYDCYNPQIISLRYVDLSHSSFKDANKIDLILKEYSSKESCLIIAGFAKKQESGKDFSGCSLTYFVDKNKM